MRVLIAISAALALLCSAAMGQEKKVAPENSKVLLLAPYLEDITPVYQYFGWDARGAVDTAYAGVARTNAVPARAQVYLHQTSPMTYWRMGNDLDSAWIRASFPIFKDRTVQVTVPAAAPGPFVRAARFDVEGAQCLAFELRHVTNDTGAPTDAERQSVSGIYCPPAGVALDDALIQRIFEGIFVSRDGRIERAMRGVNKPIPLQITRAERKQG